MNNLVRLEAECTIPPLTPSPPYRRGGGVETTFDSDRLRRCGYDSENNNGGMRCSSPASLLEGGGGKGAGGGLGIKPQYNLAYDESNKSLIFYLLTPLRLEAECTIPPLTPSPPYRRGGGVCYEKADEY